MIKHTNLAVAASTNSATEKISTNKDFGRFSVHLRSSIGTDSMTTEGEGRQHSNGGFTDAAIIAPSSAGWPLRM